MKKAISFLIVGLFLITPNAFADYTLKAKDDVGKILSAFLEEERGNRVTLFSMQGLAVEIEKAFNANIKRPEVKQEKK